MFIGYPHFKAGHKPLQCAPRFQGTEQMSPAAPVKDRPRGFVPIGGTPVARAIRRLNAGGVHAAESGLIEIGNHSWDHLHPTLPNVCHSRDARNDFSQVDNAVDAGMQIQQAEDFIRQTIGDDLATGLFAYPDGMTHRYLLTKFFPGQTSNRAAFTTGGQHAGPETDRWLIPRYVCGNHWNSTDALVQLLQSSP